MKTRTAAAATWREPSSYDVLAAWAILILGSLLPEIVWNQFLGGSPAWLPWARMGLLAAWLALSFIIPPLRRLRAFSAVLLGLHAAAQALSQVHIDLSFLPVGGSNGVFLHNMLPEQANKLAVSLALLAVLLILGFRPAQMFLMRGHLRAPITPVRWLGFPKADPWTSFGGQYSVYLALGVAAALWLTGGTTPAAMGAALPVLPAILFLAALNALNEEMVYRVSILATLEGAIGRRHAWWASAVFFGVAHFYGVPGGWSGILLATFMGWILAKAMLETRGFFWAWWIHFLQDVVIFFFIAAGSITPGG
ncbi:MAG: CPBP family intramembrane metalloprotease [Chloroflexi bacterium]|nr:CPBP family intramembrane metalloprotease [Chloroflexota bacterium]